MSSLPPVLAFKCIVIPAQKRSEPRGRHAPKYSDAGVITRRCGNANDATLIAYAPDSSADHVGMSRCAPSAMVNRMSTFATSVSTNILGFPTLCIWQVVKSESLATLG